MKVNITLIKEQFVKWKEQRSLFPVQLFFLLLLLFITPLAYGGVETWAVFFIEASGIFLFFTLFLQFIFQKQIVFQYTPYLWGVAAFFLYVIITINYSIYSYPTIISLIKITVYLSIFVLIINVFYTKKRLLFLVWAVVLFGSFYAISALLFRDGHFLGYRIFSNPGYISLTFVNRNHFAGYLEMIIWITVSLAILKKGILRIILFAFAFFIAIAIIFSLSRGGTIALLSSFTFFNLLYVLVVGEKKYLAISIVFVVILLSFLFAVGLDPLMSRFEEIQVDAVEEVGRIEYWKSSYDLFLYKPWFGSGLGTFSTAVPRFQTEATSGLFISHSHNDYFELLSEIGIIGFLIVVGTYSTLFVSLVKGIFSVQSKTRLLLAIAALSSMFSILIHSFFDFNFHIPSNALLFSVLLAIAYLSTKQVDRTNALSHTFSKKERVVFSILLVTIFIISILYTGKAYLAAIYIEKAKQALKEKKRESAIRYAERAIFIEGENASHHVKLADILVDSMRITPDSVKVELEENALRHYNIAIKQNPNYAYYHIKKAYLFNTMGIMDSARKAFERAVYLSPTSASYHWGLCNYYFRNGETERALEESKKVLSLKGDFLQSIVNLFRENGVSFDSIGKILPHTPEIRRRYITLLRRKGLDSLMIIEQRELFRLEPTLENAEKLVVSFEKKESPKQQILQCKYFLAQFPNSTKLKIYLAKAYTKFNDIEKAKNIYLNLIEKYPYYANYHYLISRVYRLENNTQMVLNSLKTAVKLAPENYGYRYALGKEYMRNHLFQLAFSEFEVCLKLNPEHKACKKAMQKIQVLIQ